MKKINVVRITVIFHMLFISISGFADITPRIIGGVESTENTWPFMSALMFKNAGVTVDNESYSVFYMEGSPTHNFSGILANCNKAFTACENVAGKICLIERGEILFSEKVANCQEGGGLAAIIYNNVEGIFLGKTETNIPALSTSRNNGLLLLNHLEESIQFGHLDEVPTFSFCGGSYIGGRRVVTAAHCVAGVTTDSIVLNIGGVNLETDTSNIINVVDIAIHRDYDKNTLNNDIAIIELETEPQGIAPVLLADEIVLGQAIENNTDATIIGRGLQTELSFSEEPALEFPNPRLYEVNLSLIDNQTCNKVMNDTITNGGTEELVSSNMLCAGNLAGSVGSCKGDSGGPLIVQQSGKSFLVGVTSWSYGCAQPDVYSVYSRVPLFKNSIDTVINEQLQTTFISINSTSTEPKTHSGSWQFEALLTLLIFKFLFGLKLKMNNAIVNFLKS